MSRSGVPPELAESLLADPAVQQAIKQQVLRSGQDAAQALQDPAVQAQLINTCKERFPQYASLARDQLVELARDPEVQRRARECGALAVQYAGQAGDMFVAQIEQGPAGVRVLAFGGGLASCVVSALHLLNPLGLITGTVVYVLSIYQMLFSLTTMLFEAKPEWIQRVGGGIDTYQDMLIRKSKFLSEALGRGLFYVFQGSLWLSVAGVADLLELVCGSYMVFVGIMNILMHYGGYSRFAEKLSKTYHEATGK
mmetsp:Transcript_108532/g.317549  ORF Transcript_108532/g.317549 Transcript_108532/m.317549 type:complete len:253 (-) Transcript_108532:151-909(-)